nr:hypothetical transcript [Hymenolepis microstoma]
MQELRASGEIGLTMAEVTNLVAARSGINISGNRLSPNDPQNFIHYMTIVNSTWDCLETEYWGPYNISIQRYMDDTKGLLDNQMMQHWSPYIILLERMIDNPWLVTARRAMNATNEGIQNPDIGRFSVRSPTAPLYFAGLAPSDPREVEALTFAGFLGIPQPANARYTEARMWNSLRQNVQPLRPLRFEEKKLFAEIPASPSSQTSTVSHSPDPFKYYTYSEYFTTDDLDALSQNSASTLLRNQINQRSLTVPPNSNKIEAFSLSDWINIAYLRVFLLVLDAYLIVSRFYSACRNFCALWLGKRRQVYHKTGTANTNVDQSAAKQLPLNEHSNKALLLTNSDIEPSQTPNDMESLDQQASNLNESDNVRSRSRNGPYCYSAPLPRNAMATAELSNDPGAADFTGFNQRGSLPACCCCLDFHYLLILFGICLMIVGLVVSTGAGKSIGNTWLLQKLQKMKVNLRSSTKKD